MSVYEPVDMELYRRTIEENTDIAIVYVTHHETGTGILNPIREIGRIAHDNGAIMITDTTSSLGMIPPTCAPTMWTSVWLLPKKDLWR